MNQNKLGTALLAMATAAFTTVLITAIGVHADGDPTTDAVPRLIPYQGVLERDGQAISGNVDMVFTLYDGESGPEVWSETQTVSVYQGRFSVLLGGVSPQSSASLVTAVGNADDLHLGVSVDDGSGAVVLTNRKRFYPAAYALWTTAATDLSVAGSLTVNGSSTLGTTSVGGSLSVTDTVTAPRVTLSQGVEGVWGVFGSAYVDNGLVRRHDGVDTPAMLWGGTHMRNGNTGACYKTNPLTGDCSCPRDFTQYNMADFQSWQNGGWIHSILWGCYVAP